MLDLDIPTRRRTHDHEGDRNPPGVRLQVGHHTPPAPQLTVSEAAEAFDTMTADPFRRSTNALT